MSLEKQVAKLKNCKNVMEKYGGKIEKIYKFMGKQVAKVANYRNLMENMVVKLKNLKNVMEKRWQNWKIYKILRRIVGKIGKLEIFDG